MAKILSSKYNENELKREHPEEFALCMTCEHKNHTWFKQNLSDVYKTEVISYFILSNWENYFLTRRYDRQLAEICVIILMPDLYINIMNRNKHELD